MTSSFYHPLPYREDTCHYFSHIQHAPGAVWLDSGRPDCTSGRYDICSAWPLESINIQPDKPLQAILDEARLLLGRLPAESLPVAELPFAGGLIGYLAYSAALPDSRHSSSLPSAQIGLYSWALINDHHSRCCGLVCHSSMDTAQQQQLLSLFSQPETPPARSFHLHSTFCPEITPQQYQSAIASIHELIRTGHCRQINYTQSFSTRYDGDPWLAYQSLRHACPTPYAAFIRLAADDAILSASPECFLQVEQQEIKTWPIKGTRPRGKSADEDMRLAQELLHSDKDRGENLMILELMLQELDAVCEPGSLHSPQRCQLYSFANVHHLISCIRGRLLPQHDALHALLHCFPAGSISGTPRQAALQHIDQLEACSREVYCGTIFYLSCHHRFDSSVTIRTLQAHQGVLRCWGGGGITLASDWQSEYQESMDKISVLLHCLEQQHLNSHENSHSDKFGL